MDVQGYLLFLIAFAVLIGFLELLGRALEWVMDLLGLALSGPAEPSYRQPSTPPPPQMRRPPDRPCRNHIPGYHKGAGHCPHCGRY
jgi:hypothetical protein